MSIILKKASTEDIELIHTMQVAAFSDLLDKYQDLATNPAIETIQDVKRRFHRQNSLFFLIVLSEQPIGTICITQQNNQCRISPMFLLPEFQNRGYAQVAINLLESLYPEIEQWQLSTIKEEQRLRYFYEKIGYESTGQEQKLKDGMTLVSYKKHTGGKTCLKSL